MPFFMVDDQAAFHAKFVAAGNAAIGLWTRAGSWSQAPQNLTEGFIPKHMARALGTNAQIKKLVTVGLWHEVEGGYQFHQWGQRQMSRAEILDRQRKRAEAGRIGGSRSGESRRNKTSTRDGLQNSYRDAGSSSEQFRDEKNTQNVRPANDLPADTSSGREASASASAKANAKQNATPVPDPVYISTYVEETSNVSNAREVDEIAAALDKLGPVVPIDGRKLVREIIPETQPHAVRQELALQAAAMLHQKPHIPVDDIRAGLREWYAKPGLGPKSLPSIVGGISRARETPPAPASSPRMTAGDRKRAEQEAVLDELRQAAPAQPPLMQVIDAEPAQPAIDFTDWSATA